MTATMRRLISRVRIIPLLLAAYAAAVGVRLAELAGEDAPVRYAAGVYGWEAGPATRATLATDQAHATRFRWSGARASFLEPIEGRMLHVPLYLARPDVERSPTEVEVRLNGILVERVLLRRNGWREQTYDLRGILGEPRWRDILQARDRARHDPESARGPAIWLQIDVTPTFVPADATSSTDTRVLGVGVGELRWSR
jgi:hypothetical protein